MANIAILGDLHIGVRDGKELFHDHFQKFFDDVFFPTCEKYNVSTIIQAGDTFDRRKFIDYGSLKRSKEYLFNRLERDYTTYMIVGNHDISLRNSLEINSPSLVLAEYNDIIPIISPKEIGDSIVLFPWVCKENFSECIDALKNTKSEICIGHWEIAGFQMNAGMTAKDGLTKDVFRKFDAVYSGHFHHRSSNDNIHYVGTPYQLTHIDYGNTKGFHILDTETRDITFIENPYRLFEKIIYDDKDNDPSLIDVSQYKDMFVKLIVREKTDFYKFDLFLEKLYTCGAYDIKVVEDVIDITTTDIDEKIDIEDTVSILQHYVESSDIDVNKEQLSSFIKQLYLEALDVTL